MNNNPTDSDSSLIQRCAAYNALHATAYTPKTYDEERKGNPRMIAWDEGWETCLKTEKDRIELP